jgi:hypothetical protein
MNGATAGSGWWDAADGDDDDAPEREVAEPPLDNRTTQQVPLVDPTNAESTPPPNPWSSTSPDTVRVEAPAWFLRAQKRAAEQNRAAEEVRAPDPAVAVDPDMVEREGDTAPPAVTAPGLPPSSGEAAARTQFLDPTIAVSYREPRPAPDLAAGTIGLLGAAMLSIGSLMTWARSSGAVEATVTGLTGSNGWGTLACGVVVGFGAVLVLTGRRGGLVGGAMLIAALAAVYLCGFSAVDILRTSDELPEMLVGAGVDRGSAEVSTLELTQGFALVAAGTAAALAAGTIAFARRV